jgi:hypothetical protein
VLELGLSLSPQGGKENKERNILTE